MFDGIALTDAPPLLGIFFLVFFPYYQMARGKLVPRSALEDEREDTEKWHQAHDVLAAQLTELLEQGRTTDALLRAIAERAEQP